MDASQEKEGKESKKKKETWVESSEFKELTKKHKKQIEELNGQIKQHIASIKKLEGDLDFKNKEIKHYKELAADLAEKIHVTENAEQEYCKIITVRKFEIEKKEEEIGNLQKKILEKQKEIDSLAKEVLSMKDAQLDFEAQVDSTSNKEKSLKDELVLIKEQVKGKDQAISALG